MTDPAPEPAAEPNPERLWFGQTRVTPEEKTRRVRGVFHQVARRYDVMNDLMSGGMHRVWKRRLIDRVRPRHGEVILDVAGGTGDIAFRLLDRAGPAPAEGGGLAVLICDLSADMVEVGRDRALDRGRAGGLGQGRIDFVVGNAETLPLPDASVDAYTISFGLRNVTRIDVALAEARRVLRPGGRFFCLEFSRVPNRGFRRLYEAYSDLVIPRLGQRVAKDRDSYRYLVDSIRKHPDQPTLARRMERAGLARVSWENLTGGIAAIHHGYRI